jgi:PmbA protein
VAEQALSISARNKNQQAIEPGEYSVVLAPNAVGLLLYYLSWMGLHARSVQSRQSFLTDRWGEDVLDEKISIWDDGLDGNLYAIPFDWEGIPKQVVDIINHGRAAGVVYDSATAHRDGRTSSGHALSTLRDRYYSSPLACHLVMAAGENSLEEMVASTERGVLINHLWYVREVHYGRTIVTGMTRDGTFWIEDGKIKHALRNLRFTQSIAEALQQVDMVGNSRQLSEQFIGQTYTPALKLRRFGIVGASTF